MSSTSLGERRVAYHYDCPSWWFAKNDDIRLPYRKLELFPSNEHFDFEYDLAAVDLDTLLLPDFGYSFPCVTNYTRVLPFFFEIQTMNVDVRSAAPFVQIIEPAASALYE